MKGTLGVFGHPLGSLLGTAASLSGSIRTSLLGVAVLPPRLRPPRHVSTREPLSIYNYIDVSAPAVCLNADALQTAFDLTQIQQSDQQFLA